MADPWKALDGDDGAGPVGPRQLAPFTAPGTVAPRGSTDSGEASQPGTSQTATPGLAGHRALAALAEELAQAAAIDEAGADVEPAERVEGAGSSDGPSRAGSSGGCSAPLGGGRPVPGGGSPGAVGGGSPSPAGGGSPGPVSPLRSPDPVAGGGSPGPVSPLRSPDPVRGGSPSPLGGARPVPGGGSPGPVGGGSPGPVGGGSPGPPSGAAERPAGFPMARPLPRLPLPGSPMGMRVPEADQSGAIPGARLGPLSPLSPPSGSPAPGAMRLPTDRATASAPATAEQSTIPLRKRAISDLPASVAPASPDTAGEAPAAAGAPATVRNVAVVEAWSAREDDILPRRQVRRARPFWRRR